MASIRERNGKFNVIYSYTNEKGERKQKWETYETKAEAKRRKKEIEYKKEMGSFVVRKCKTLDELITEYVALYGKENWALSTYEGNVSLINNYILPIIGDTKLSEINTRFIERYYQSLLKRRAVINPLNKTSRNEFVSSSTVRDINKLLRNCFEQAVKWELMEKNPCTHATVPKHKSQKRDIWTADTLMYALSVCEDERLKLAINLSFSCSLRLGELLGLTWDCVDISHEAIEENRAYVFINKESQRIRKESLNALDGKDSFYRIPKLLFTNDYFKALSNDAKILYGLMLDRMSLSVKNQWFDEENKAYIYFSEEKVFDADLFTHRVCLALYEREYKQSEEHQEIFTGSSV